MNTSIWTQPCFNNTVLHNWSSPNHLLDYFTFACAVCLVYAGPIAIVAMMMYCACAGGILALDRITGLSSCYQAWCCQHFVKDEEEEDEEEDESNTIKHASWKMKIKFEDQETRNIFLANVAHFTKYDPASCLCDAEKEVVEEVEEEESSSE